MSDTTFSAIRENIRSLDEKLAQEESKLVDLYVKAIEKQILHPNFIKRLEAVASRGYEEFYLIHENKVSPKGIPIHEISSDQTFALNHKSDWDYFTKAYNKIATKVYPGIPKISVSPCNGFGTGPIGGDMTYSCGASFDLKSLPTFIPSSFLGMFNTTFREVVALPTLEES